MRVSTFAASPVALLALVQLAAAAVIQSPPSLVTCQPAAINWSDAPAGDIFLSVIEGGNPASANLVSFPTQSGSSGSYTWNVNLAAGTSITLKLVDSTGQPAYSSPVTIQAGSSTDCVGQEPSGAAGGAASSAASSASSLQSSASSGASSAAAGATSSASSAASSISSEASNALSSASSVAASVTSAAGSRISSALGGASSVASSVASAGASSVTGAATLNKAAVSAVLLGAAGAVGALMA